MVQRGLHKSQFKRQERFTWTVTANILNLQRVGKNQVLLNSFMIAVENSRC